MIASVLQTISPHQPVLIAGPTASGKSALALAIAERQGGIIVNADASQVYDCWRIITARPSAEEEARAPHALYGHQPYDARYSTGDWLREVRPLLSGQQRPIIVGGTGLYFSALTEGLSDIPPVPPETRDRADALTLEDLKAGVHPATLSGLDQANRARVQRAWEVQHATGQPLHVWQNRPKTPELNADQAATLVMDAPKEWLTPRIERRFHMMMERGALEEVDAMRKVHDASLPAFRAIGVPECMAVLRGDLTRAAAIEAASIATRQYAKRQRTWFRSRMSHWRWLASADLC